MDCDRKGDELFMYDEDKKIYVGHIDMYYCENFHNNMTKNEAINMLSESIKKFVSEAKELKCEHITDEYMVYKIEHWFGYDMNNGNKFDHLFCDEDGNIGDDTWAVLLNASGIEFPET